MRNAPARRILRRMFAKKDVPIDVQLVFAVQSYPVGIVFLTTTGTEGRERGPGADESDQVSR